VARICVVRQFYFPLDIRVRREVEALLGAGHEVDVVCLRAPGEPSFVQEERLTIRRLPMKHTRGGIAGYLTRYPAFLAMASATVAVLHLKRRYDIVQVHSLPDTLVLAGAFPRLLGARVLLDLHEVMPEFVASKFRLPMSDPKVRMVARAEQFSIRMADAVLTCTDQMKEAFVQRGAPADKITVILNSADEAVFDVVAFPPSPQPDRFTLVCHGTIEERYGLDLVIEAVALLRDELPNLHFEVYGQGEYRERLEQMVRERGLEDRVHISRAFIPMADLLRAISRADVGVVAMKQDVFRDLTHCNKMFEFLALQIPVITSRTRSVAAYFPDEALRYFRPGDVEDLADAIRELHADAGRRQELVEQGTKAFEPYRWPEQRRIYREVVSGLLSRRRKAGQQPAVAA
jgi:glycosyltransferase involved in cell wall biosynthesis